MKEKHGEWWVEYNPKPIPSRKHDYDFWHEDYDGPGDTRCGTASSVEECKAEIAEIEADL